MIIHTTLIRQRPGGKMVGMLGVLKYTGGDLSGITRTIYRPSRLFQYWFSIKYRKRVTHCATVFYEKNRAQELKSQLSQFGINAVHTEFKHYNVMKAKMYLEDHEATVLRIIA